MRDEGVIYVAGHPLLNRRCTRLPGCIRLRNDLYCVEWDVKLYSLTHPLRVALCLHAEALASDCTGLGERVSLFATALRLWRSTRHTSHSRMIEADGLPDGRTRRESHRLLIIETIVFRAVGSAAGPRPQRTTVIRLPQDTFLCVADPRRSDRH